MGTLIHVQLYMFSYPSCRNWPICTNWDHLFLSFLLWRKCPFEQSGLTKLQRKVCLRRKRVFGKVQFQHFQLVPFMRSAKELQGARSSAEAFGGRSAASAWWSNPQCNSNFSPPRRVTDFNWFPGGAGPNCIAQSASGATSEVGSGFTFHLDCATRSAYYTGCQIKGGHFGT